MAVPEKDQPEPTRRRLTAVVVLDEVVYFEDADEVGDINCNFASLTVESKNGSVIGWDKSIFQLGAQPFLLAELLKILIATFTINQIKKIKKFI